MPIPPSPFSSVPQFLQQGAQPAQPGQSPMPGGPGGPGGPSSMAVPPGQPPAGSSPPGGGPEEPDLFQRVAGLLTQHPQWLAIFAGMGMREALEKTGKYQSKPHRSNDELQQMGVQMGPAGQVGMPTPGSMAQNLQPPTPGPPGIR